MRRENGFLVEKPDLEGERPDSKLLKLLSDKEDPLCVMNRLCYQLELFFTGSICPVLGFA